MNGACFGMMTSISRSPVKRLSALKELKFNYVPYCYSSYSLVLMVQPKSVGLFIKFIYAASAVTLLTLKLDQAVNAMI